MGTDTLLVRHDQPQKGGLRLYVPLLLHVSHSDFLLHSTLTTPPEGLSSSRGLREGVVPFKLFPT